MAGIPKVKYDLAQQVLTLTCAAHSPAVGKPCVGFQALGRRAAAPAPGAGGGPLAKAKPLRAGAAATAGGSLAGVSVPKCARKATRSGAGISQSRASQKGAPGGGGMFPVFVVG